MRENVGTLDSALRIFTGGILAAAAVPRLGRRHGFWPWALLALGTYGVTTGATRWCPVMGWLDLSTAGVEDDVLGGESVDELIERAEAAERPYLGETPPLPPMGHHPAPHAARGRARADEGVPAAGPVPEGPPYPRRGA